MISKIHHLGLNFKQIISDDVLVRRSCLFIPDCELKCSPYFSESEIVGFCYAIRQYFCWLTNLLVLTSVLFFWRGWIVIVISSLFCTFITSAQLVILLQQLDQTLKYEARCWQDWAKIKYSNYTIHFWVQVSWNHYFVTFKGYFSRNAPLLFLNVIGCNGNFVPIQIDWEKEIILFLLKVY